MPKKARSASPLATLFLAAAAVAAVAAPVAAAAPPQQVTIVSDVTFNPNGPNYGDFSAAGAAVDSGLLCPSGTFVDTFIKFGGFQSRIGLVEIQVAKTFTCGDGSGTFDLKLQINTDLNTGTETFNWVVTGGTGAYAALAGAGGGSTVPTSTGNINTYVGSVH
jgi:hypothetical protein